MVSFIAAVARYTPYIVLGFAVFQGGAALAQAPLSFVSVSPCRVVDTRNPAGPFGGPTFQPGTIRTFPIPQGSCNVPANAAAYFFNLAAAPQSAHFLVTIWPTGQNQPITSNLNDPLGIVVSNGTVVMAGTNGAVNVFASSTTDIILDLEGYFIAQSASTSTALGTGASNAGVQNTAVGFNTLQLNAGTSNTAVGSFALAANSAGNNNVALGANALLSNALGSADTAIGTQSLLNNLVGNDNTAVGFQALNTNTVGGSDVAIGASSLGNNLTGSFDTAVGTGSLSALSGGSWNIALGYQAGESITTGSNNIDIGHQGLGTDSGVIRIGTLNSQTSTYVSGINNATVTGVPVLISSAGQLGVASSSERFKDDIANIGADSDAVMQLRPVSFRYRVPLSDGSKPLHYGLIAEEVATVYPNLVFRDLAGKPFTVAYQELPVLLLSEVQKQHGVIEAQRNRLNSQQKTINTLERRIAALETAVSPKR